MLEIVPAHEEPLLADIRVLFREYAESLGFHLCFQDFDREMAELPGKYTPPEGRLLIAKWSGRIAGCVAMKQLGDGICEMKRFYVRPELRGKGIGQAVAKAIIEESRLAGYARMRLDTVPSMQSAIRIYESLGFKDTEPYVYNPVPGVRYLELQF
ncbi:MAG TPA: GNAT family N-acetyltransferase [Phycisphaerae bacterium]|nr:GNAT family N-acetyltransferase [Phycisphaerae bacterium]